MVTPELVDELCESSSPNRRWFSLRSMWLAAMLPLLLLFVILGPEKLPGPTSFKVFLPWGLLAAYMIAVRRSGERVRRSLRTAGSAYEAARLQDWDRAETLAINILKRPINLPSHRAKALLALAAVAEHHNRFDSAQVVYEHLLSEGTADPTQLQTATLSLAGAMLRNEQVTDAVQLIDQLRRMELPESIQANVELLALYREVTMGQHEDALADSERRRELFRKYLSTKAGYGYALLAAGFERAGDRKRAEQLWRDATMLVSVERLCNRFRELIAVAEKYPATPCPI